MKSKTPPTIEVALDEVKQAKEDLVAAETAVEQALQAIERLPRAHKAAVSEVVSLALGRLRIARSKLEDLVDDGAAKGSVEQ
jgi:hypothetical protein